MAFSWSRGLVEVFGWTTTVTRQDGTTDDLRVIPDGPGWVGTMNGKAIATGDNAFNAMQALETCYRLRKPRPVACKVATDIVDEDWDWLDQPPE